MMNTYGDFNPSTGINIPQVVCYPSQDGPPSEGGGFDGHSWMIQWLAQRQQQLIKLDTSKIPFPPGTPIGNIWTILAELEAEAELNMNLDNNDDLIGQYGLGTHLDDATVAPFVVVRD